MHMSQTNHPTPAHPHTTTKVAPLLLALGVACGAFGAHALKDTVPPADLAIWEKAVLYHLVHSLAILVVAGLPATVPIAAKNRISWILLLSILIFSGTLYGLVLSNQRWLGAITPIGGSGFILAWALLSIALMRAKKSPL